MHALDFYTSTCRWVMQADPDNPATLVELRRLLPCLRQALGCYVCFRLLKDPMGPNHNVCKHSVCLNCLGGKMKLKPACSWCKDHYQFVPNALLKILTTCFKKLCLYISCSSLGIAIRKSSINGETNHLLNIIQEGIDFQDDYVPKLLQTTSTAESDGPELLPATASVEEIDSTAPDYKTEDVENKTEQQIMSEITETNTTESATSKIESLDGDIRSKLLMPSVELQDINLTYKRNKKNFKRKRSTKAQDRNSEMKLNTSSQNKSVKKPIIFMKRATLSKKKNNNLVEFKSKLASLKAKKKAVVKNFNTRRSKQEAPTDLERIDNTEPSFKKLKVELQPPELKPLSSCNCGKTGNFNQLTCIGQRCPCYSMKLPCVDCKCKGCRNPKKGPEYKGFNTIGNSTVLRSGTRNATEALCVNM